MRLVSNCMAVCVPLCQQRQLSWCVRLPPCICMVHLAKNGPLAEMSPQWPAHSQLYSGRIASCHYACTCTAHILVGRSTMNNPHICSQHACVSWLFSVPSQSPLDCQKPCSAPSCLCLLPKPSLHYQALHRAPYTFATRLLIHQKLVGKLCWRSIVNADVAWLVPPTH